MRNRTAAASLFFLLFASLAAPAIAQVRQASQAAASRGASTISLGFDYSLFRLSDEGFSAWSPVGWIFSASGRLTDTVQWVGDVSGHYSFGGDAEGSNLKLHLFQAGARYLFKTTTKARPWVQGMVGASHASNESGGNTDFVFTPGIGFDTAINDKWSFRGQVDFPFISTPDSTAKGVRIGFGVSTNVGGK